MTSTRQAESQGLNRFKTGTLSYGDIANHANYRGSAMSMDGQITLDGQGGPKKIGNQQLLDVAKYAGESQRALGVGQTRDSQQSTTRSGINTANLEITDMARQQMQLNYQTAPAIQMNSGIAVGNPHPVKRDNPVSLQAHLAGIKTDTDTQTVAQQAQALTNRFDKDKVQRELDFQVNTTKQFGQTLAEAKRQTKAHLLTNASEQTKQYVDWAFDTLGADLTTGSVQAAGVAAVSPFANRTIKQLTTDRQTGETNLVTNTLAHAALGALEAKVTGNNAAAGAMAGAGGELAAHFAAKAYGVDGKTKTTQDLTEQEKATVKTLGQLGGMAAGGLIGDNSQSAVNSMQIAERAVEHNYLFVNEAKERDALREKVNNGTASERDKTRLAELDRLDISRDHNVVSACQGAPLSSACRSEMAGVEKAYTDYFLSSTERNIYGYPVYTRNHLLYTEEANKVAGFASEYDLQKALKDKNIRDVANAYGWDENTLRKVDAWSQVGADIAAGWAGYKVVKGALDKPPVIPKEANANSKLPPAGEITDYKLIKVDFNQSLIKGSSESKLVNDLKSDTHYELSNGTKFKTNDYGHVEEISYSPVDMKMPRDKRQTLVGKEGLPTDVGGHIQACAHGGTCDRYNLFPQDANFNNSAYKKYFENIVSKALKEGKSVEVNTKFIRNDPSSARPDKLEIQFSVDGVKQSKIKFDNKGN